MRVNDNEGKQSIYSIETCAYGASKNLVSEKEEIICNNVDVSNKGEHKKNIIQIGHKFLIIRTEY